MLAPEPNTDANSEVMLIVSGTDPIPLLSSIDLLRQVGGNRRLAYSYTGANGFQVVEFEVKGANGMSAWDGYLESGDDGAPFYAFAMARCDRVTARRAGRADRLARMGRGSAS